MKRIIVSLISVLLISFLLCGCFIKKSNEKSEEVSHFPNGEITTDTSYNNSTEYTPQKETFVNTKYYKLTVPASWENKYITSIKGSDYYSVVFYEKNPNTGNQGAYLFSLSMLTLGEDYTKYSNYIPIGSIRLNSNEQYNLVALLSETLNPAKESDVRLIIDSISFFNPSIFSQSTIKPNSVEIISTKYFNLKIPKDWEDKVIIDRYEDSEYSLFSISFSEKNDYHNYGGHLFTIMVEPITDEEIYYPSFDILGQIKVSGKKYNVIALYPTDVQYSPQNEYVYSELYDQIDSVLDTIEFKY